MRQLCRTPVGILLMAVLAALVGGSQPAIAEPPARSWFVTGDAYTLTVWAFEKGAVVTTATHTLGYGATLALPAPTPGMDVRTPMAEAAAPALVLTQTSAAAGRGDGNAPPPTPSARPTAVGGLVWNEELGAFVGGDPSALTQWFVKGMRVEEARLTRHESEGMIPAVFEEVETQVVVGRAPDGTAFYETVVEQRLVTPARPGTTHVRTLRFRPAPQDETMLEPARPALLPAPSRFAPAPGSDQSSACGGGGACG